MASSYYPILEATSVPGRNLKDRLRNLLKEFDAIDEICNQMVQAKDGNAGDQTDFVTNAANFGYDGADGTAKATNAKNSFSELDSMRGTCAAALRQCCNRHLP